MSPAVLTVGESSTGQDGFTGTWANRSRKPSFGVAPAVPPRCPSPFSCGPPCSGTGPEPLRLLRLNVGLEQSLLPLRTEPSQTGPAGLSLLAAPRGTWRCRSERPSPWGGPSHLEGRELLAPSCRGSALPGNLLEGSRWPVTCPD